MTDSLGAGCCCRWRTANSTQLRPRSRFRPRYPSWSTGKTQQDPPTRRGTEEAMGPVESSDDERTENRARRDRGRARRVSAETEEPLTPLATPAEKADLDRLDRQLSMRIERECGSLRAELMERIQGVSTRLSAEIAGVRTPSRRRSTDWTRRTRRDSTHWTRRSTDWTEGARRDSTDWTGRTRRDSPHWTRRSTHWTGRDSERLAATRELLEQRIDDRTRQLQAGIASLKELVLSRLEEQRRAEAAEYSAMKWSIRSMMAAMALLVAMMAGSLSCSSQEPRQDPEALQVEAVVAAVNQNAAPVGIGGGIEVHHSRVVTASAATVRPDLTSIGIRRSPASRRTSISCPAASRQKNSGESRRVAEKALMSSATTKDSKIAPRSGWLSSVTPSRIPTQVADQTRIEEVQPWTLAQAFPVVGVGCGGKRRSQG